jgi:hypothetical protein
MRRVIASRGRPFNCRYCFNAGLKEFYNGLGKYVRQRSPENIIAELKEALSACLAERPPRPDLNRPRLPIDRVFTMTGFGSVVTGTLTDGHLQVGDEVEILPGGSNFPNQIDPFFSFSGIRPFLFCPFKSFFFLTFSSFVVPQTDSFGGFQPRWQQDCFTLT